MRKASHSCPICEKRMLLFLGGIYDVIAIKHAAAVLQEFNTWQNTTQTMVHIFYRLFFPLPKRHFSKTQPFSLKETSLFLPSRGPPGCRSKNEGEQSEQTSSGRLSFTEPCCQIRTNNNRRRDSACGRFGVYFLPCRFQKCMAGVGTRGTRLSLCNWWRALLWNTPGQTWI